MTEYELVDLLRSGVANMLAGQAIYFTQLGSYLLVAYLVGSKLTKFQVSFLNFLLIVMGVTGMSGFLATLRSNFDARDRLIEMGSSQVTMSTEISSAASFTFVAFRVVVLIGCLVFMWQVRHPKTE